MTSLPPIGLVLAGGRSRRFGQDKARFVFEGRTLVERAWDRLGEVVAPVLLADAGRDLLPGLAVSLADGPGSGPAAGMLAAAAAFPGRAVLALACDLPRVPGALLQELAGREPGADLLLPRWHRGVEPLCGRWGPAALAALERRVTAGRLELQGMEAEAGLRVALLEGTALAAFGEPAALFANLNTPGDLADLAASGIGPATPARER